MELNKKEAWQERISKSGMTGADYPDTLAMVYDMSQSRETLANDKELKLIETH
ncbi:hypothetical protein [Sporomusa termitida]|nr:hypothetical protein [Sporomusa termitida]